MSVYSHSGPFSPRTIKGSCCWSTTGTRYPCEMVRKRAGNVIAAANQACWNLFPAVYRRAWQIHRGMKTVLGQRRCSSMEREPWVIDVPAGACMVVRGSPRPVISLPPCNAMPLAFGPLVFSCLPLQLILHVQRVRALGILSQSMTRRTGFD